MQVLGTRQHLSRDSSNSPTPQYETGFSQHKCLKASLNKGTSQKYKWVTLDPGFNCAGWGETIMVAGEDSCHFSGSSSACPVLHKLHREMGTQLHHILSYCQTTHLLQARASCPRKWDLKKCSLCTKTFSTSHLLHIVLNQNTVI